MQPITHTMLSQLRHGFFTRVGGVSEGIFASLNVGLGSSDVPERVTENRARVAAYFDAAPEALMTCYQVHSPDVVTVTKATLERKEADAMVTNERGIVLGILTADCASVLFADSTAGVIGAAHAGWKGALCGVCENTIAAMEALGATRENIRAVVGPCIGPESYEVGAEFVARFRDVDATYERFFTQNREGHALFDLPNFVLHRLSEAGVHSAWCGEETLANAEKFFSYRRKTLASEPDYGRQISAIMLK